jgi:hypothetical protein|uniref:hypothetical protein n=1 Tax=Sphingomonas sp. TaxID=28214 RepID=UPI003567167D
MDARQGLNDLAAAYECLCTDTDPGGLFPNARLQAAAFAILEAELPRDSAEGRTQVRPTLSLLSPDEQRAMRNALDRWTNEGGATSR